MPRELDLSGLHVGGDGGLARAIGRCTREATGSCEAGEDPHGASPTDHDLDPGLDGTHGPSEVDVHELVGPVGAPLSRDGVFRHPRAGEHQVQRAVLVGAKDRLPDRCGRGHVELHRTGSAPMGLEVADECLEQSTAPGAGDDLGATGGQLLADGAPQA